MKINIKKLLLLVAATIWTAQIFSATTYTVSSSGTNSGTSWTTIAAALNAASSGDEIDIAAGTYTEKNLGAGSFNKSITIKGAGMGLTILQAYATPNNTPANNCSVFNLDGAYDNSPTIKSITIQDMTIQNGYNTYSGGGIRLTNSGTQANAPTLNLTNLKIASNNSANGGGVYIAGYGTFNITGCNITGNSMTTSTAIGGGIAVGGYGSTLKIMKSTIAANSSTGNGGGIGVSFGANAANAATNSLWIENSTIYGNSISTAAKIGGGVYFKTCTSGQGSTPTFTLTINHCTIANNTTNSGSTTSTSGPDGVAIENGGGYATTIVMNNSIIMGNSGSTGTNACQIGSNNTSTSTTANGKITASPIITNSIFGIYASGGWVAGPNISHNDITGTATMAFAGSLSSDPTPVLPIGFGSLAKDFVTNNQLSPALTADQLGNTRSIGNYPDAGAYEYTTLSSTPTITFATPTLVTKTYGDASFTNAATSTSGTALVYSSDATGVATVNANTGAVTILSAGTAHITASQIANSVYTAGNQSYTLTIDPKVLTPQTISFGSLTSKSVGDADYNPGATASSGLTVSYASSNASVATIVSNQIHIIGPGATVITASQGGDSNYSAASNVTQNLIIMSNPGFEDVVSTFTVAETSKNVLRRISGIQSTLTSTSQPISNAISVTNGMWVCNNPKASGYLRATVVTSDYHSGTSSLNLVVGAGSTATNLDDWSNITAQQKLSLLNTQKYSISFWAKADGTANNQCSNVTVYLTDNTLKTKLSCVVPLTGGTSWTQYSAIFDIPAFKAANATADFSTAYFGVGITTTYDPNTLKTNYSGILLDDFMLSTTTSGSIAISTSTTNGTVTGTGVVYDSGASASVLAVPNNGYRFLNWTENGNSVSTNALYTFSASNRTLIANFEAVYTVAASCGTGGTMVSGSGTYLPNSSATVVATAISGYRFVNWTENSTVVSTNASYSFTVSASRTLVANFAASSLSVSETSRTGFTYSYGSGPSSEQSFTVGGTNLNGNITITPPTNYEISTATGASFVATNPITLVQSNGTVSSNTIYIRLKAGKSVNSYNSENIVVATTGVTSHNVVCSGSVSKATPGISVTGTTSLTYNGAEQGPATINYNGDGSTSLLYTSTDLQGYSSATAPTNPGAYQVVATATEGTNYNAASSSALAFSISKANQSITFTQDLSGKKAGDTDFTLTATSATSGVNGITFASSNESVATISGSTLHIVGAGTTNITASQAGNTNYNVATPVIQEMIVAPSTINLTGTKTSADLTSSTADVTVSGVSTVLTVDNSKTVKNLTLGDGALIKLSGSNTLTVSQNLDLKADLNGSFSLNLGSSSVSVSGTARYLKTIDDQRWYFVAFPFDVPIAGITKTNGPSSMGVLGTDWFIKYYDGNNRAQQGTGTGVQNWIPLTSANYTAEPGTFKLNANQGYIIGIAGNSGTQVEISFPIDKNYLQNETDLNRTKVPVTAYNLGNPNDNGWNLIGQPYLSKYDGAGADINYMTFSNNGLSTYTTLSKFDNTLNSKIIDPFAAYFVQVPNSTNQITFATGGRKSVRSLVAQPVSPIVQLNMTTATGTDNTTLILDDQQSTAYQIGQDMEKWIGTGTDKPQLYSTLGNVNYAFNALPLNSVNNLPLAFYTKTAGTSTIHVDATQAKDLSELLLTDKETQITTNLLQTDYSFTATAGTTTNRLVLNARKVVTDKPEINNHEGEPQVIINNSKILINNLTNNATVRVYDMVGHLIYHQQPTSTTIEIPVKVAGVYNIQLQTPNRTWTQKVVVK